MYDLYLCLSFNWHNNFKSRIFCRPQAYITNRSVGEGCFLSDRKKNFSFAYTKFFEFGRAIQIYLMLKEMNFFWFTYLEYRNYRFVLARVVDLEVPVLVSITRLLCSDPLNRLHCSRASNIVKLFTKGV